MNNLIMKAISEGLADFIRKFFASAARQGFAVMILFALVIALGWFLSEMRADLRRSHKDCEQSVTLVKTELNMRINNLSQDLDTCNRERHMLAIRVAELSAIVKLKLK